jgi:hypothetical protein
MIPRGVHYCETGRLSVYPPSLRRRNSLEHGARFQVADFILRIADCGLRNSNFEIPNFHSVLWRAAVDHMNDQRLPLRIEHLREAWLRGDKGLDQALPATIKDHSFCLQVLSSISNPL